MVTRLAGRIPSAELRSPGAIEGIRGVEQIIRHREEEHGGSSVPEALRRGVLQRFHAFARFRYDQDAKAGNFPTLPQHPGLAGFSVGVDLACEARLSGIAPSHRHGAPIHLKEEGYRSLIAVIDPLWKALWWSWWFIRGGVTSADTERGDG